MPSNIWIWTLKLRNISLSILVLHNVLLTKVDSEYHWVLIWEVKSLIFRNLSPLVEFLEPTLSVSPFGVSILVFYKNLTFYSKGLRFKVLLEWYDFDRSFWNQLLCCDDLKTYLLLRFLALKCISKYNRYIFKSIVWKLSQKPHKGLGCILSDFIRGFCNSFTVSELYHISKNLVT